MTSRLNGTLREEPRESAQRIDPLGHLSSSRGLLVTRLLRCGRTVSLQLWGVLDWRTAPQFSREVAHGLTGTCRRVVVDLTRVEYVGGDVLHGLVDLHAQLSASDIELRLVVPEGSRCARSVALTGLDRQIPTYHHPDEAWQHRPARCLPRRFRDLATALPSRDLRDPAG
jgi:anti-anti-sigma factor